MNNFQNAELSDNGHGPHFSETVSFAVPCKEVGLASKVRQRNYSEEELGYQATCEESYDIMAQTIAVYANTPNALYAI